MESKKRKDYLLWDEYFMAIAKLSAMRSKDPSTQVGACIVSNDNRKFGDKISICMPCRIKCNIKL